MTTLDELVVRIKADASQLDRELKRISGVTQQQTNKMQSSLSGLTAAFRGLVPALTIGGLVAFGKHSLDAVGRMKDLSTQIGFAASTLSALERPLSATGASLDQFATAVNLMNANIGQAAQDLDGPISQAFARLHLDIEALKKLSPEEQFYAIANALAGVGTQFEQTELGRAIFGRGFANLIPLIKEANGNLDEHVQKLKDTSDALDQETIDRIDAFGDAMASAAIKAKNEFIELFAAVLKVSDYIYESFGKGGSQGNFTNWKTGLPQPANTNSSSQTGLSNDEVARIIREGSASSGGAPRRPGAKSLSDGERERNRIMDEGRRITEQNLNAYERYAEGVSNAEDLLTAGAIDQITYQREILRLQQEMNTEIGDGTTKAAEQAVISAKIIKDSFGDALESAIFDFESFGNAATGILNGIARNIARSQIIDPLSSGLSNGVGGLLGNLFGGNSISQSIGFATQGGYGPFPGYADGGDPPVGRPSWVGERGPEIFVPRSAGTIIPNHATGGTSVTVVQHNSFGSGVTRAEVASMLPALADASKRAVFEEIQKGGRGAQIAGRRS